MPRIAAPALLTAVLALAVPEAAPAAEEEDHYGLPEDPGREEVLAYCGACHSMKLVVQQGLTRADWAELLVWMYEEQEMDALEAGEETLVLDYLAKHVGPDSQKARLRERGILP